MGEKILIRSSGERIGFLSSELIKESLMKETGLKEEVAEKIAKEAEEEIKRMNLEFVSAPLVREVVCIKLLEHGLEEERKKYTRLGRPVYDVTQMIFTKDKENANTFYNPEFVHKELGSAISKEYALLHVIPLEASDAHMRGEIHIHTLEYFITRPFCFEHSMHYFLINGVKTDGRGIFTAVPKPPKHLDAAMMQLAKVLQMSQMVFSGGQGFDSFNVFLAPYAKGLSYEEIKQAVQYFIFELDMMNFSRGGQTAFTNVSLEFSVPEHLADVPVVLPGGVVSRERSYLEFEEEARLILKAFIDLYMEGDALGKPFNFPKLEFKLRKGIWENSEAYDLLMEVSKLTAKFGVPYFLNLCPDYMPNVVQSQCCRYFMIPDSEQMQKVKEGKLRFGSLQVVSLNLPRLSYLSKDEDEFFEKIREKVDLAAKVFDAKRKILKKYLENGGSPILTMDYDGEPYFVMEEQTNTIGFVGLNEAVQKLLGEELHESKEAWLFGLKVVKYLRDLTEEKTKETGQRYGLVQTPAESTASRFASLDLAEFGDKSFVKGDRKSGSVYYTNSSHVYVGANVPLWQRIKIESSFHPLVKGGAITHVWLGEAEPDPRAIYSMIQRISTRSLCSYFAFTRDFTVCRNCRSLSSGIHQRCPRCKSENVEGYSRITGYLVPINAWNSGKLQELRERRRYAI